MSTTNDEKITSEIHRLYVHAIDIFGFFLKEHFPEELPGYLKERVEKLKGKTLHQWYQHWYSKTLPVVKHLAPDRYEEFVSLYLPTKNRAKIVYSNYTISDFLIGMTSINFTPEVAFSQKFQLQIAILESIKERAGSILSNLSGLLQSEIFDHEIDAASHLLKNGHMRASGAVAGHVLEAHLAGVCDNHQIVVKKKNPTLSDYYSALKENAVIEVPMWRFLQYLGDIRNKCVHKKDSEPSKNEVEDLIEGTKKSIKSIW